MNVFDSTGPTVSCFSANLYLNSSGAVSTNISVLSTSTDNCAVANTSINIQSFNCSNLGPNSVVITSFDPSGNSGNCTAVATVIDSIPPTITTLNTVLFLNQSGYALLNQSSVIGTSSDNCQVASFSVSSSLFDCSSLGNNSIVVKFYDSSGNVANASAIVTVRSPPFIVSCVNVTLYLSNGLAILNPSSLVSSTSYTCGLLNYTASKVNFTCADIGSQSVILTLTDSLNQTATCNATVTVQRSNTPSIQCYQNVSLPLSNINSTVPINQSNVVEKIVDDCSVSTLTISPPTVSFTSASQSTFSINVTAIDSTGLVFSCNASTYLTLAGMLDVGSLLRPLGAGFGILWNTAYPYKPTDLVFLYYVDGNNQNVAITIFPVDYSKGRFDWRQGFPINLQAGSHCTIFMTINGVIVDFSTVEIIY